MHRLPWLSSDIWVLIKERNILPTRAVQSNDFSSLFPTSRNWYLLPVCDETYEVGTGTVLAVIISNLDLARNTSLKFWHSGKTSNGSTSCSLITGNLSRREQDGMSWLFGDGMASTPMWVYTARVRFRGTGRDDGWASGVVPQVRSFYCVGSVRKVT